MNHHDIFMKCASSGKCEVCGIEAPVVVVSSRLGPCSCAYCEDCYDSDHYDDDNDDWDDD